MKYYLAAPVVADDDTKAKVNRVYETLCKSVGADNVYRPGLHKVPNEWGITMQMWGQCVFTMDVLAIDSCEWLVLCDFGRGKASAGTAWECGYAFAKGKRILVITMPGANETSLMLNGCAANVVDFQLFIDDATPMDLMFVERGKLAAKQTLH